VKAKDLGIRPHGASYFLIARGVYLAIFQLVFLLIGKLSVRSFLILTSTQHSNDKVRMQKSKQRLISNGNAQRQERKPV